MTDWRREALRYLEIARSALVRWMRRGADALEDQPSFPLLETGPVSWVTRANVARRVAEERRRKAPEWERRCHELVRHMPLDGMEEMLEQLVQLDTFYRARAHARLRRGVHERANDLMVEMNKCAS